MNKPGCHRTGLDAHFGVDTSMLRNTSRNWPGIGGADAAPEPLALRVDNADRGRLLRYVQPNIMRHRNLRWCKPPGNLPGSRHYRCLRLRPAITRGPHMAIAANVLNRMPKSEGAPARASSSLFCSIPNRRAQNLFYFWLNFSDHQLHRLHCRLVLGVAHLERETNVDWMCCTNFANQLFSHGLDITDQQVISDGFK